MSGPCKVTLSEQIEIIELLRQRLGLDSVHMFAASWGAIVGASYAATFSQKVKRLLLASMACKMNEGHVDALKNGLSLIKNEDSFGDVHVKEQVARIMMACFGDQLSDDYQQKIVVQFRNMSAEHARCFYEHCLFLTGMRHISDLTDLRKIEAETLLVRGEIDTVTLPDDTRYLCGIIPRAQEVVVKNAGHFLHVEPGKEGIIKIYAEFFRSGYVKTESEAELLGLNASEHGTLACAS